MKPSQLETMLGLDELEQPGVCPGCGLELEEDESEVCYLCASGFALFEPRELKGGGYEMVDKPVFKTRIGGFSAAVFLNEVDGRKLPSVVAEKSFTKDGMSWERQKISLLNASEVDKLICVLEEIKRALYLEDFS